MSFGNATQVMYCYNTRRKNSRQPPRPQQLEIGTIPPPFSHLHFLNSKQRYTGITKNQDHVDCRAAKYFRISHNARFVQQKPCITTETMFLLSILTALIPSRLRREPLNHTAVTFMQVPHPSILCPLSLADLQTPGLQLDS